MTTADNKAQARKEILALRDALSEAERKEASTYIARLLILQPEYAMSMTILFYVDFRSEVMTREMIGRALASGRKVLVPKVDRAAHRLRLFEIRDLASDLEKGYMGIYEPREALREADPTEVDLVIMPGVGFDLSCGRLGYGGGYYDRLIETLRPDAKLVALAYEAQISESVPCEAHDRKADKLVTEKRAIRRG